VLAGATTLKKYGIGIINIQKVRLKAVNSENIYLLVLR
jgi:hypothetical protein